MSDPSLLSAALRPRSVAIVGASDNPNKVGGRPLLYLSKFGYQGRIFPINPHRREVQGVRAYPDLASLPEAPDLAIIATPGDSVPAAVDECATRGVQVTIVISSGYGETADQAAIAAEREMVRRARAAGMRLVGPNCQGLANFGTGVVASFSTMFLETEPMDGPVGIISQSGIMSTMPYGLLRARGLGVRHSHATGNEADVTLSELALAVVQDEDVRLLLLYIESVRNAEMLAQAAAIARARDVPIVAVKTGRTARGQKAARSHTGALANEDRVVDAFFERHGIWRVDDIHELVGAAELYLKGWRPANRRLVVVSNSGASCVMAADSSEALGLELAALAPATVETLASQLPSFATATNPIDITAALLTDSQLFGRILDALAREEGADLCLVSIPVAGVGYDVPLFARETASFMARTGKAVALAAPQASIGRHFRAAGVPWFENQTEAIRALAQVAHHAALMRRRPLQAAAVPPLTIPGGDSSFLSEAESLSVVDAFGVSTVPRVLCTTLPDAQDAARRLGVPVVMKGCARGVPHKSEHGLVLLNVQGGAEIDAAFATLTSRLEALGAGGGILVSPMLRGRRVEMLLGARVDPVFGPVVMLGRGGTYVEVYRDVQLLIPPFSLDDARAAVERLTVAPFFAGVRGEAPLDIAAFCDAAVKVGALALAGRGVIASIDLNPVMVGPVGKGVVVADALVERCLPKENA